MTRLLLVCTGGALGSGARYLVSTWAARALGADFPRGTLLVNVAGSFLLSFLMGFAGAREAISPEARLFLGAGEGTVFTAGSAWNVDMAPPERRGRMIGLYGLAIWTGLTLGPPIGVLLQHAGGYNLVWAFAAGAPLMGAVIASRLPESVNPQGEETRGPLISREAAGPGGTFALSVVGFAAISAFIVLALDQRGIQRGCRIRPAAQLHVGPQLEQPEAFLPIAILQGRRA